MTAVILATSLLNGLNVTAEEKESLSEKYEAVCRDKEHDYKRYSNDFADKTGTGTDICIPFETLTPEDMAKKETCSGKEAIRLPDDGAALSTRFTVEDEGLYEIELSYCAMTAGNRPLELALELDGNVPFCNAAQIQLNRVFEDETPIRTNSVNGNESAPRQIERLEWQNAILQSLDGDYSEAYAFNLSEGVHTLKIVALNGDIAVNGISLLSRKKLKSYAEYHAEHSDKKSAEKSVTIQAEKASKKSSQTFSPSSDRTSPKNEPSHITKIRINVIGNNWNSYGDWIEWNFDAPSDGLYCLYFRYQQDANKGMPSCRSLTLDGEIPFDEAKLLKFGYTEKFSSYSLCVDGEPVEFYLNKGTHTVRLQVVSGQLSEPIYRLTDTLDILNTVYREVIMVTGVNPDKYTDYDLDVAVPELSGRLKSASSSLKKAYLAVQGISDGRGNQGELLNRFANQLDSFCREISSLPLRLTEFRDNISALSSWIVDIRMQPLLLDSFTFCPAGEKSPYSKDGFFSKLWFEAKMFVASFFNDYNSFASVSRNENITLWLSAGRDQAQVIKMMTDDMFTPDTGIGVEIKLVSAGLTQAYLSGDTPDVSIMQGRGQPVNLGARGALLELNDLPDFDKVVKRFSNTALIPYTIDGKCYGLPDSQSFYMMFYRKDIFEELGLKVPQTWDELLYLSNVLQRNNMEIGLPYTSIDANASVDVGMASRNIYSALLLQNGGKFYVDNLSSTAFSSENAQQAFKTWTDFYLLYDVPLTYNFYNRFRTGEMPLGIADYTFYNQLTSAALEIRNLWEMVPIPGTKQSDGTINRAQGSTGSSAVIMKDSKHRQAAWDFICWWTSAEAQSRYMQDIESVLGVTARYPTATLEALKNSGWSKRELENINAQWEQVEDIPEVIGSYYVVRGLDNAFREVILEGRNPREALSVWNRSINEEIDRKRREFGYETHN